MDTNYDSPAKLIGLLLVIFGLMLYLGLLIKFFPVYWQFFIDYWKIHLGIGIGGTAIKIGIRLLIEE